MFRPEIIFWIREELVSSLTSMYSEYVIVLRYDVGFARIGQTAVQCQEDFPYAFCKSTNCENAGVLYMDARLPL